MSLQWVQDFGHQLRIPGRNIRRVLLFFSYSFISSSVIYANRHYLEIYRMYHPERLQKQDGSRGPTIVRNRSITNQSNLIM